MDDTNWGWALKAGELRNQMLQFLRLHFSGKYFGKAGRFFCSVLSVVVLPVFVFVFVSIITPNAQGVLIKKSLKEFHPGEEDFRGIRSADHYLKAVNRETGSLERKLRTLLPARPYLVVNTSENRIFLYSGEKLIHEGICSTGSYTLLKAGDDQEWIFSTPKGMFRIQGKVTAPVWRKPDWAFIEEGLPVPHANSNLRFERGVLGDYALNLGDGYLIHGTLYQRFLGLPVTHGCIRLGDEDLRKVYNALHIGSKVYIY
jgi:hypothetical protein